MKIGVIHIEWLKKSAALIIVLYLYVSGFSQGSNNPIAPFKIRLTNGQGYTYAQLPKNKPVILIYFSPTCDHCKTFTEDMLKRIDKFQHDQLVMISFEDIKDVKAFDDTYKLSGHQNIKIGSEGYTFIVQKYYNITRYPFIAEYDKNGKLKKMIRENVALDQL